MRTAGGARKGRSCGASRSAAWRALVICAAVGGCVGAGPASALDDAAPDKAMVVASAHWPSSTCRGLEFVVWVAQAELDTEHPGERAAADASAASCTVRLSESARRWRGPRVCELLAHEFGHLAGKRHSSDPADVMHGGTVPWTYQCTRAFPPREALSPRRQCQIVRGTGMTLRRDCRPRRASSARWRRTSHAA